MKTKRRDILIFIVVIAVAITVLIFYKSRSRFSYNNDFVNGNFPGNLYNGGYFCESDDLIYFSNPQDDYALYSMNQEGKQLTKLTTDYATYINADANHVYYIRNNSSGSAKTSLFQWGMNGLCRIAKSGGDPDILETDPCIYACLCGNYIYYHHYSEEDGTTLYKINIDGNEREEVLSAAYIMCDAVGKYIYYSGVEQDHNLYRLETTTDTSTLI